MRLRCQASWRRSRSSSRVSRDARIHFPTEEGGAHGHEARFELAYAKARAPIAIYELTTSRKKLMALGCLQHSVEWFAANIARLKPVVENARCAAEAAKARFERGRHAGARLRRTSGVGGGRMPPAAPSPQTWWHGTARSRRLYHAFASTLLFTLRLELRLRILAYLHLSIADSSYAVNDTPLETRPTHRGAQRRARQLRRHAPPHPAPASRSFVFSGISMLIDTNLISLVHELKAVNREGTGKLLRNILALQQNLKNILPNKEAGLEVNLDRARRFYELLYAKTPAELLKGMRRFQQTHTAKGHVRRVRFEELQACCSSRWRGERAQERRWGEVDLGPAKRRHVGHGRRDEAEAQRAPHRAARDRGRARVG